MLEGMPGGGGGSGGKPALYSVGLVAVLAGALYGMPLFDQPPALAPPTAPPWTAICGNV